MTPSDLDRYRVIAQLGRGGMSDVYLAASRGEGGFSKLLVVKVLQASLARDDHFLAMFRDEARLAARLNHPNVVQTYEVGESDGRHFITMEYLEGQPLSRLSEVLGGAAGIPLGLVLRIVMDALAGLHYAHELREFDGRPLGVVHRDMTPQNLFLTYEGQVKLLDFGIAKAFDSTTVTQLGTVKGKVAYMAPEQARGEPVDRRADLFSMGVVAWELLSQRRLWEGLTDIAVVGRLVQGDIPDLRDVCPNIPPGLAATCMRSLDPDPLRRPQTAAEMQRQFEVHYERLSVRPGSRHLGEVLRREFAKERAQVRSVVNKQLQRLARESTPGSSRSPALAQQLGTPPILGEGSEIHDAVTALHTEDTASFFAEDPSPSSTSSSTSVASATSARHGVLPHTNQWKWFAALAGVGALGVAVGVIRPWEAAPSEASTERGPRPEPSIAATSSSNVRVPAGCDAENKPVVELTGELADYSELTCDKDYLLRFTTFVSPGATLKIQPGTRLLGDLQTKGKLVVQPGGRIEAVGTPDNPIVFTSAAPDGQRSQGDWGGVVVLGHAPLNLQDQNGQPTRGRIEGLTVGGEYGGTNENDSSGALRYVRIEYSGTEIAPNNEINGLTLGGVGRGTVVDHIQVRHTADDCFEFFGGTVDAKYLVCEHPDDDAFDWDYGYTGRLQFLVAQMAPTVSRGAHGLEGDNDPNGSTNRPVSAPLIYNITLCGKNRVLESQEHYGILLRRATAGRIRNAIVTGFSAGLDVRDADTKPNIAASLFFGNLVHNLAFPERREASPAERLLHDDDAGFDELAYLRNPGLRISEADPHLGNCFASDHPDFKPSQPLLEAAAPPDDGFFDTSATFLGAFRDRGDDWQPGKWLIWGR